MFDALGNAIAYSLFGLSPDSHLGQAVQFFVMDITKIFVLLIVIIYIMCLLRAMLSPERVREYVRGKPKWLARTLAILLGAVTPFLFLLIGTLVHWLCRSRHSIRRYLFISYCQPDDK